MATSSKVLISVKHLVKEYNHGTVHALDGCDLDIHKGEVVAIIGPSGSGKSTLLRSLNMLEEPTSGAIFFDGVDLADKSVDINLHRQKMGMVFQHFNLFPHKTVLQNITLAPVTLKKKTPAEAETQARTLLERIGLSDKANEYPNMLSGGQKQRIAIVRALTTKYRDLTQLVTFGLQLFMYATPVIYPLNAAPEKYRDIIALNPLTPIFETFKYSCMGCGSLDWGGLAYSTLFMLSTLFCSVVIFSRVERNFMDTV